MADLTTTAAVKSSLQITTTDDDDLIALYVSQASQMIETQALRQFSATPGTLTLNACAPHLYGNRLFFDTDVLSVASVADSNGTLSASQYTLLPLNESPKYGLHLKGTAELTYSDDPIGAITVVGTLGYCTAANRPADITLAATKMAAWLYQTRDNNGEIVRFADGSTVIPAEAPSLVMRIMTKYTRMKAFV